MRKTKKKTYMRKTKQTNSSVQTLSVAEPSGNPPIPHPSREKRAAIFRIDQVHSPFSHWHHGPTSHATRERLTCTASTHHRIVKSTPPPRRKFILLFPPFSKPKRERPPPPHIRLTDTWAHPVWGPRVGETGCGFLAERVVRLQIPNPLLFPRFLLSHTKISPLLSNSPAASSSGRFEKT